MIIPKILNIDPKNRIIIEDADIPKLLLKKQSSL